jgi:branched-chain amino acid aminotransferase
MKIWFDGKLVEEGEAKVSVFDHGLLYGDGVFEGIRFYDGRVFRLEEHITRLFASARAIMLEIPWTEEEICGFVCETIAANSLNDGYVRLVVTRGPGGLGLNPFNCEKPSMFIIATTITFYPESLYEKGLELVTCATRRPTPASLSPQVKSLNYLNNVMGKIEAIHAGVVEGLMLNERGFVAECTGDNIFIVRNGTIITPPVSDGALDGITRRVILELAESAEIKVIEQTMSRIDIFGADECFVTGTAAEVAPVVSLDKRKIGTGKPGPVTRQLIEAYRQLVRTTGTPVHFR